MFCCCLVFLSLPAFAQESTSDAEKSRLAAMAESILTAEEGLWNSVWETINDKGEVVKTVKGVESFTPFNGSVRLMRTRVEGADQESTAFRFYNPSEQLLYIIDVSSGGQHFILQQKVGDDTIVSEPFASAQGGLAVLRFSVIESGEDWKLIRHEISRDNGKTWRQFRRQRMDRVRR